MNMGINKDSYLRYQIYYLFFIVLAANASTISKLPDVFSGKSFYFQDIDDEHASQLKRYIIAYPCFTYGYSSCSPLKLSCIATF